jgi:hypothetical protein
MSNPVTPFRNNLFASRGMDIQSALDYAEMMINTLSATDQVAVRTAFGVVINTIESAVTQSQGPSPEKIAIIALIDERIDAHKLIREDAIGDVVDAHIHNLDDKIADWMDNNLRDKMMDHWPNDDIDDQISNWMSNNFDITDYNVDDAIDSWMENNMDDKIQEAINNLTFSVTVS